MLPTDAFAAIGTSERVASSLYKWAKGKRGFNRTVAIELRENIELIRMYIDSGAERNELIPKISDAAFRNALAGGFNFNSMKRSKIGVRSTKNIAQLKKYHGWKTQKIFENIYQKVATLKHAATIKDNRKSVRIGARLNNVFRLMVMLAIHIGN